MNSKATFIIGFVLGIGVGSIAVYIREKDKYEKLVDERVASVKEVFEKKKEKKKEKPNSEDLMEYSKKLLTEKYTSYNDTTEEPKEDHPVVIDPGEVGMNVHYGRIDLRWYADGVLVDDESNDPIDNIDFVVGKESLLHFGEIEGDEDTVYVRNDKLRCYYTILRDEDPFYEDES